MLYSQNLLFCLEIFCSNSSHFLEPFSPICFQSHGFPGALVSPSILVLSKCPTKRNYRIKWCPTWSNHWQSNRARFCHPLFTTYNKQSHQKDELMWWAKAMLTDEQRECRWSVAHQVKIPTLKIITLIPVLLCVEAQAPTCTWVTELQQSLCLAYKDPMFRQKPQGCLSKPTNRLNWQPHAHHSRTQKTQGLSTRHITQGCMKRHSSPTFAERPTWNKPPQHRTTSNSRSSKSSLAHFRFLPW